MFKHVSLEIIKKARKNIPVDLGLCKTTFTSIVCQICVFNIACTRRGKNSIQNVLKNRETADMFSCHSNDV